MRKITKNEFVALLDKYLKGEATPEELEFLIAYYNVFDIRSDVSNTLNNKQLQELEFQIKLGVDQQIQQISKQHKTITVRQRIISGIAVAAVTIAVILLAVNQLNEKHNVDSAHKLNATVAQKSNFMELPDGSIVILEPGSRLDYSPFFLDTTRDVYLTGQAYFDVKQFPKKPFIVHTGKLTTTVLGTAFNIKALSGDSNIVVTVTRGKVKLSNEHKTFAVLTRDQQLVYYKNTDTTSQEKVAAEKSITWMQGDLFLDNVTVQNAAVIIGERYGVYIEIIDEQLKGQRFTTSLNKDDSLETIIKSIAQFNSASYKIDKEKKHVTIRMDNR